MIWGIDKISIGDEIFVEHNNGGIILNKEDNIIVLDEKALDELKDFLYLEEEKEGE